MSLVDVVNVSSHNVSCENVFKVIHENFLLPKQNLLTVTLPLVTDVLCLQEVVILKRPNEKLGISIRGGSKGSKGNPLDADDEGIFISKVSIASSFTCSVL